VHYDGKRPLHNRQVFSLSNFLPKHRLLKEEDDNSCDDNSVNNNSSNNAYIKKNE